MEFFIAFFGGIYIAIKLLSDEYRKARFWRRYKRDRAEDAKYIDEDAEYRAATMVRLHRDEAIEKVKKYLIIIYDTEEWFEFYRQHHKIKTVYIKSILLAMEGKWNGGSTSNFIIDGLREQIKFAYAVEKCFHDHGFDGKYYFIPYQKHDGTYSHNGVIGGRLSMECSDRRHPEARRLWENTDSEICPVNWTDIDL